jgi:hypothetical protein
MQPVEEEMWLALETCLPYIMLITLMTLSFQHMHTAQPL